MSKLQSKQVVGYNVRRIREAKKLTQTDLAKQSGVPQPRLSLIEGAKHDLQCTTLDRLAKALGVTPADLLKPEKKSRRRP